MTRYHSKHLHFELNKASVDTDNLSAFARKYAQNFVAFTPDALEDTLMCYGSRSDGKRLRLENGAISLAKKLRVRPTDITLHHIHTRAKYPDAVFNLLDPARISEQLLYTAGEYASEKTIEVYVETIQAKRHAEEKKAEKLRRDVKRGLSVRLTFSQTNNVYHVESFKGDRSDLPVVAKKSDDIEAGTTGEEARQTSGSTKKKHHYFYSTTPGYGKSAATTAILHKLNATALVDAKNWTDCSPDSQFIIVDEYGESNRFAWDDLKRLTSGNASTFEGSRESCGASFRPRADAQLILFGDTHLFECAGKKITGKDEDMLRDRFHIHKLDEENTGVTEKDDAKRSVEERKRDLDEEDVRPAKRPRLKGQQLTIDMLDATFMDDEEIVEMVKRHTPRLKRMLEEEIQSGRVHPDHRSSPYDRMKHLLRERFGSEAESVVCGNAVFVAHLLIALG